MNVLDFAGQIEYYVTHQLFLSDIYCVYVLVSSLYKRKSFKLQSSVCAEHLMSFIRCLFNKRTKVLSVIALTHGDCGNSRQDEQHYADSSNAESFHPPIHGLNSFVVDYSKNDIADGVSMNEGSNNSSPRSVYDCIVSELTNIYHLILIPGSYNSANEAVQREFDKLEKGKILTNKELMKIVKSSDEDFLPTLLHRILIGMRKLVVQVKLNACFLRDNNVGGCLMVYLDAEIAGEPRFIDLVCCGSSRASVLLLERVFDVCESILCKYEGLSVSRFALCTRCLCSTKTDHYLSDNSSSRSLLCHKKVDELKVRKEDRCDQRTTKEETKDRNAYNEVSSSIIIFFILDWKPMKSLIVLGICLVHPHQLVSVLAAIICAFITL